MNIHAVQLWRRRYIPCCVLLGVHGREGREEAFSHSKCLATRTGSGGGETVTAMAIGGGANVEWLVVVGWTGADTREGSGVVHRARRLCGVQEYLTTAKI